MFYSTETWFFSLTNAVRCVIFLFDVALKVNLNVSIKGYRLRIDVLDS